MALVLEKGRKINLEKDDTGEQLTRVRIGLSWEMKPGLDADLDASVVLLGKNMKMWRDDSIVCYATPKSDDDRILSDDGAIEHAGDKREGHASGDVEGEGDDESIEIDLSKVASNTQNILVVITSYAKKGEDPVRFGRVKNATVRLYDIGGRAEKTVCEFDLSEDMGTWTSMEMAMLAREGKGWTFTALGHGVGSSRNGLEDVMSKYA
jgi:stress response protein SCP2